MKSLAAALAIGAMLTVEQRDRYRSGLDGDSLAVSSDGRFVAFVTYAQLAAADTDRSSDLYVLDRIRQEVTFESTDADAAANCIHPGISGDGRYVVYQADSAIVWRDRTKDDTRLAGHGRQPAITEDGHTIVFTRDSDVYAMDVRSGDTRRVNIDVPAPHGTIVSSVSPSASADGRYVAFAARPPFAGGRVPESDVFVRDTHAGRTRHIGRGWSPAISADGRFVAFVSPMQGLTEIVLADLQASARPRVITRSARRGRANGSSVNPGVSASGRYVVFQSEASDLVAGEDINLLWDVFRYDREQGTIVRVSGDRDGVWMEPSIGPAIDATGSVVAFSSRHPTGAGDKDNDFDLYVATLPRPSP
jgi:Tol biopolymer transport system component